MKREFDGYDVCNWCAIAIILIMIFAGFINSITKCNRVESTSSPTPVEEMKVIDSLSKDNEKLVIEVNNLDSIKNVKTIEVKSLDNDSTLKLFYELISR